MQQLNFFGFWLFDDKGNLRLFSKILFFFTAALIALAVICVYYPPRRRDLMAVVALPFLIGAVAILVALPIERLIFARWIPKYKHFGQTIATYITLTIFFIIIFWRNILLGQDDADYSFWQSLYRLLTKKQVLGCFHLPMCVYILVNGFISKYAPISNAKKNIYIDILDDI